MQSGKNPEKTMSSDEIKALIQTYKNYETLSLQIASLKVTISNLEGHIANMQAGIVFGNLDRAIGELPGHYNKLAQHEKKYQASFASYETFKQETLPKLVGTPYYLSCLMVWQAQNAGALTAALLENITGDEAKAIDLDMRERAPFLLYLTKDVFDQLQLTEDQKTKLREELALPHYAPRQSRLMVLIDGVLEINWMASRFHNVPRESHWKRAYVLLPDYIRFLSTQLGYDFETIKTLLRPVNKRQVNAYFLSTLMKCETMTAESLESLRQIYLLGVDANALAWDEHRSLAQLHFPVPAYFDIFTLRHTALAIDAGTADVFLLKKLFAFSVLGMNEATLQEPADDALALMSYKQALIKHFIETPSFISHQDEISYQWFRNLLAADISYKADIVNLAVTVMQSKKYDYTKRHDLKAAYVHYVKTDEAIQSALRQQMILGRRCLMLNVLMSHQSSNTLVETPDYKQVREQLKSVNVSGVTLAGLKAQVERQNEVFLLREACLYVALTSEGDSNEFIQKYIFKSASFTEEAKNALLSGLKLLNKDDFGQLKFRLNQFIAENEDAQKVIKQLRSRKQEERNPVLFVLMLGRSKCELKQTKHYQALTHFLKEDHQWPQDKLEKFGLFSVYAEAPASKAMKPLSLKNKKS